MAGGKDETYDYLFKGEYSSKTWRVDTVVCR